MARSLVVKHEEKLGTSSLLNLFLLLIVGWMVGAAAFAAMAETTSPSGVEIAE